MQSFTLKVAAACLSLGLGITAASADSVITFNDLQHGEVVNTQYQSLGVTINAVNFHRDSNLAVAFDTNATGTEDSDLEGPFSSGNMAGQNMGNALIIQEGGTPVDGIIASPDDEGRRPAGFFRFKFDTAVNSFGFDLIDIEGPEEFNQGYFLSFATNGVELAQINFSDLVNPLSAYYDSSIAFGDHSANTVSPFNTANLGIGQFDEVIIGMGGSGAIDNVTFNAVPTPGAFAAGLALIGGLAIRRRHKA